MKWGKKIKKYGIINVKQVVKKIFFIICQHIFVFKSSYKIILNLCFHYNDLLNADVHLTCPIIQQSGYPLNGVFHFLSIRLFYLHIKCLQ